jgi:hypothetical protein
MTDARSSTELARSCRLIACHQQNPNILDMLHELEEDFLQKAKDTESRNGEQPPRRRQEGEKLRASPALWST